MQPLDWHKKRTAVKMSQTAELMLHIIHKEGPLPVMDALGSAQSKFIASMATLHGGLKWLREHSYVKIQELDGDQRTKVCVVTAKGNKYLEA
jgi:hypothetical protein